MLDGAIKILNLIEQNGFEAYIVGGYVRDKLLGIKSSDIDITTNARPDDLINIFDNIISNEYGSIKIKYGNNKYQITTYRKDLIYDDFRRPKNIEYVDSLSNDLLRRDFTINTLCMDKNQNIIDLLDASSDIKNRIIRCVGDPKVKLKEDSLRILRAIRFACILNFSIEPNLLLELQNNSNNLLYLSYDRKKDELNKIFSSQNVAYGIDLINKLSLDKKLEIEAKKGLIYTDNVLGIWAQINFSKNYNFSNAEINIINDVRYLINKGNIDIVDIYKLKKESILIASQILDIDYSYIKKLEKCLPMSSKKDIDIKYDEIVSNFNVLDNQISDIYIDLEEKILYNIVKNKKRDILEYLRSKYEMR